MSMPGIVRTIAGIAGTAVSLAAIVYCAPAQPASAAVTAGGVDCNVQMDVIKRAEQDLGSFRQQARAERAAGMSELARTAVAATTRIGAQQYGMVLAETRADIRAGRGDCRDAIMWPGPVLGHRVACAPTEDSFLTTCGAHPVRLAYRAGGWYAPGPVRHLPAWFHWGSTSDRHHGPCIFAWGQRMGEPGNTSAEICASGVAYES